MFLPQTLIFNLFRFIKRHLLFRTSCIGLAVVGCPWGAYAESSAAGCPRGAYAESPVAGCPLPSPGLRYTEDLLHPLFEDMLPRITHIALHVQDLEACIEFYRGFCAMETVHERRAGDSRVVWLSESGRERDFVFVLMDGGADLSLPAKDYRHFGFAVSSRAAVDEIAVRAEAADCLLWSPRDEPFPVGYYCGLRDPNGNQVEFSWGQPLGPGAPALPSAAGLK